MVGYDSGQKVVLFLLLSNQLSLPFEVQLVLQILYPLDRLGFHLHSLSLKLLPQGIQSLAVALLWENTN